MPWTVVCQAPLSMGFSRPEYWSGLPFPSPGDLPDPGIEPGSPAWQVDTYHLSHQQEQRSQRALQARKEATRAFCAHTPSWLSILVERPPWTRPVHPCWNSAASQLSIRGGGNGAPPKHHFLPLSFLWHQNLLKHFFLIISTNLCCLNFNF